MIMLIVYCYKYNKLSKKLFNLKTNQNRGSTAV